MVPCSPIDVAAGGMEPMPQQMPGASSSSSGIIGGYRVELSSPIENKESRCAWINGHPWLFKMLLLLLFSSDIIREAGLLGAAAVQFMLLPFTKESGGGVKLEKAPPVEEHTELAFCEGRLAPFSRAFCLNISRRASSRGALKLRTARIIFWFSVRWLFKDEEVEDYSEFAALFSYSANIMIAW